MGALFHSYIRRNYQISSNCRGCWSSHSKICMLRAGISAELQARNLGWRSKGKACRCPAVRIWVVERIVFLQVRLTNVEMPRGCFDAVSLLGLEGPGFL